MKIGERGGWIGKNLRGTFKLFEEASWNGHVDVNKELAECYLHVRECEKDLIKAAELGDSKMKLKVAKKMEKEEQAIACDSIR